MSCIDTISRHASVREYTGDSIPEDHIRIILEAARRAPTAWNLMPVLISAVTDRSVKKRLAEAVGGQRHVAEAPLFLVFSADLAKLAEAARIAGVEPARPGIAVLVEAIIAAGIMSGWAGLAAESLGYGITYIAVYSDPCRVNEILGLGRLVVPLVGITVGRPAEHPQPRPRQDPRTVYVINSEPLPARERGRLLLELYGGRAGRIVERVLGSGGYHGRLNGRLRECLERLGVEV